MVSPLIADLRRANENIRRKRTSLIEDIKSHSQRAGMPKGISQPGIQKNKMEIGNNDWEYVVSYSLPEECFVVDTNRAVCYEGCSTVNPHLADSCDRLGDYFLKCPTYKYKLNGGKE